MQLIPIEELTIEQAKKELASIELNLAYHDNLYYQHSNPQISDSEYDQLKRRCEDIARHFPSLARPENPNWPLNRVGGERNLPLFKITHSLLMPQMIKIKTEEGVRHFMLTIYRQLKKEFNNSIAFTLEPKIDGASISIRYEKGQLVHAALRGDGYIGEDISVNIRAIKVIPEILPPSQVPEIFEVRGEIYIAKSDFLLLNKEMKDAKKNIYSNPRNTASGLLRHLDLQVTKSRRLKFFAHGLGMVSEKFAEGQYDMLGKLRDLGFPVIERFQKSYTLESILSYYHETESIRGMLDYDIDGVVYKVDRFSLQEQLGVSSPRSRWSISHKFPGRKARTRLIDIDIQIGRTGILTPVARLDPVNIGGVFIANATLHNEDYIKGYGVSGKIIREGRDIRIGDTVVVKRAGDVIPKIVDIILQKRPANAEVFSFPDVCPICQSRAVRYVNPQTGRIESARYCTGWFICPAQQLERLKHFVSRGAFNIEGLGQQQLDFFFKSDDPSLKIRVPADIFTLQSRQELSTIKLEHISGFGQKSVENLYNSINTRRDVSLHRFIFSLGIRHVGIEIARSLAKYYHSYQNFEETIKNILHKIGDDRSSLTRAPLVGAVIAESIIEFYQNLGNNRAIEELLREIKLPIIQDQGGYSTSSVLYNKVLVFTGTLQKIARDQAREAVCQLGAHVSSTVSKKTDIVVVGMNPGSKLNKAQQLGIDIMYEDDFLSLLPQDLLHQHDSLL
ncbi:MAG: NAD-dependent DNA ligase LigA [Candidatus Liberibacter ctenarytainae]|uniref:DNA ligase n=1 Tax=Candidatus Liberibacter ctenarytainae TaxID=2020335 RepID=A0A937AK40_9HYPH|nr:NAD-dependent DNA ligase LigA [Candidatus Liberibacter ctenarytainae]